MTRYIVRRLLICVPVLWGITLMTFVMTALMPGDYVDSLIPREQRRLVSPEYLARLREHYGLNKTVPEQYVIWMRELLRGNLGYSFTSGEPVLREMLNRLPATLELTITAMLFSVITGTALGLISAIKQYSKLDHLLTFLGLFWISTPNFVFALAALFLFAFKFPLFPLGGEGPVGEQFGLLTRLQHLFLPAIVLGLEGVAGFMRYTRSSLLEVFRSDYITTARAKGLINRVVLLRHAFRNALLPLITIMGLQLPGLIGGAFIIETIFVWPGLGRFGLMAVQESNVPSIMAVNLIASSLVLLSNLVSDIGYSVADPRIHYD